MMRTEIPTDEQIVQYISEKGDNGAVPSDIIKHFQSEAISDMQVISAIHRTIDRGKIVLGEYGHLVVAEKILMVA